jgi:hypothetical protein
MAKETRKTAQVKNDVATTDKIVEVITTYEQKTVLRPARLRNRRAVLVRMRDHYQSQIDEIDVYLNSIKNG